MRAALLVLMAASCAALALGAACSSFGSDSVADAGPAPDTSTAEASTEGCSLPAAPVPAPAACAGGCLAELLYPTAPVENAVVADKKIYIVRDKTLQVSADIANGVFTKVGTAAITGTVTKMAADARYVYVSSQAEHVRVELAGGLKEQIPLLDGDLSPVFFGDTVFFQLQPTHVIRTPKDGGGTAQSVAVAGAAALALDGDVAYWIGPNASAELVLLGPFPALTEHGVVTGPVLGFAVHDDVAYVAEKSVDGAGSTISQISLKRAVRTALVKEPGKVESLHVRGNRLYWRAVRTPSEGSRVFASSDLCGGASRTFATDLPLLSTISYEPQDVYAAGVGLGPVYRLKD